MTTRERILEALKINPILNQQGLAKALSLSEATISYHLKKMEKEGIIKQSRSSSKFIEVMPLSSSKLDSKFSSYTHVPTAAQASTKLKLRLHRLQRSYPILNAISEQKLINLKKMLLNNNHQWIGKGFRITTKNLVLEGIQLWSDSDVQAGMIKGLGIAIADQAALGIAEQYGFTIDVAKASSPENLAEIELTEHELAGAVKERGIIGLHFPPGSLEPDVWMDKSFGFGGFESNVPALIQKLTDFTNAMVEDSWNYKLEQQARRQAEIRHDREIGEIRQEVAILAKNINIHEPFWESMNVVARNLAGTSRQRLRTEKEISKVMENRKQTRLSL